MNTHTGNQVNTFNQDMYKYPSQNNKEIGGIAEVS